MHHHTQRAMIGIRRGRMDVRNLDEREQRQKHQANQRSRAPGPSPTALHSSPISAVTHENFAHSMRIHRFLLTRRREPSPIGRFNTFSASHFIPTNTQQQSPRAIV